MNAGAAIEPRGRRPKRLTPGRIGLYAFLVISALFFLMPLLLMVMTSMKSMAEIRGGNIFALPTAPTFD
jgi:glucose/mannose transport system permease protein